jgi:hypothetical protein
MQLKNKKGQFVKTTGTTERKRVQYKGKIMHDYQRIFCQKLGIDFIPKPFVVHHLDEDKKNSNIDNLALMTITAHNRIHAHTSWNKGLTMKTSKKWAEAMKKRMQVVRRKNMPMLKRTFELQLSGKKLKEIAMIEGVSTRCVLDRIKNYKRYIKENL